jgi:hypothetical protein
MFQWFLLNKNQRNIFKVPSTSNILNKKYFLDDLFKFDQEDEDQNFSETTDLQVDKVVKVGVEGHINERLVDNYLKSFL